MTETLAESPAEQAWRESGELTPDQHAYLLNPIRSGRIATRTQGGKQLSYLEAWEVRAHLIRIFGFGNFDVEVVDSDLVFERAYMSTASTPAPMIEVAYKATVRLTVRDKDGRTIATYQEGAVGQANVGEGSSTRGDAHDNALKTAASDAFKRCAMNLGTQFGLSLYNDGSREDVVRLTLVGPKGMPTPDEVTPEQMKNLETTLGATKIEEPTVEDPA